MPIVKLDWRSGTIYLTARAVNQVLYDSRLRQNIGYGVMDLTLIPSDLGEIHLLRSRHQRKKRAYQTQHCQRNPLGDGLFCVWIKHVSIGAS